MTAETPLENQDFTELQVQTLWHHLDATALAILWAKKLDSPICVMEMRLAGALSNLV